MPLKRVSIPSPNYSSRGGARVTTIVLHTAEGATTYQSLGAFFQNPASGVSSHVGIDDTPGTVGEYVPRSGKSWTAASANPWSVQAELCAFAAWSAADWSAHPQMLANTAAWIAEEAAAFGIPLTLLSATQAQDPNAAGVCQHADLGAMGGGHWDCGPAFPIQQVLSMAAGGAGGGTTEDDLPLNDADKQWISKAINDALRQQFAPEGECYARVVGADAEAIRRTPANIPK